METLSTVAVDGAGKIESRTGDIAEIVHVGDRDAPDVL